MYINIKNSKFSKNKIKYGLWNVYIIQNKNECLNIFVFRTFPEEYNMLQTPEIIFDIFDVVTKQIVICNIVFGSVVFNSIW